jgi:hypothetical protein
MLHLPFRRTPYLACAMVVSLAAMAARAEPTASVVRSAHDGPWSAASTWEGARLPAAGAVVQVRPGHIVIYDLPQSPILRAVHIAGTLTFAPDRDTVLCAALVKVQDGDDINDGGSECGVHHAAAEASPGKATLQIGTLDRPIDAGHTAIIRLTYLDGLDPTAYPALLCCGGRLEFNGAPMTRTWVKLGETAAAGSATIRLAEAVNGWRTGDHVILTATTRQSKEKKTFKPSVKDASQTEERAIVAIDATNSRLTLDRPLQFDHLGSGDYRGEIANLSRNVVVESADPAGVRGHTMIHHGSLASIRYAEFRHLGKAGELGRYSLHFHLCGDSIRGSSVVGASIWDSANRWITVHGTNDLVVRDCVGYRSEGHGFFLEDGTETDNLFDRNLAVDAFSHAPLKDQVFSFDQNDGAGFWWANSANAFTRNAAVECDEYGYFFQAPGTAAASLTKLVRRPDGTREATDIRTLPFLRFDGNESHTQRRHAFNLGGGVPFGPGVAGVGPDAAHPFVIRNTRLWDVHWAFHPVAPSVMVDRMDVYLADYAIWRPVYQDHAYRSVTLSQIHVNPEFTPVGKRPDEKAFPNTLHPVDDVPPVTVITDVRKRGQELLVRGVSTDNGAVRRVVVNGVDAAATAEGFAQWEATVPMAATLTAGAEDAAGNVEKTPHVYRVE